MAIEVVKENTTAQALDMNRNQALTQDNTSSELPEQTSDMQMGGM